MNKSWITISSVMISLFATLLLTSTQAWSQTPEYDGAYVIDEQNKYIELKPFKLGLALKRPGGQLEIYPDLQKPVINSIKTGFDSIFIKGEESGKMALYSLQEGKDAAGDIAFLATPLEVRTKSIDNRTFQFEPKSPLSPRVYYARTSNGPWLFEVVGITGRLTIQAEPSDARVRIMNIGPKYEDGIELIQGVDYDLIITKEGFNDHKETLQLTEESTTHKVVLTPK